MIREAIADLATGRSLGFERAHDAMAEIMEGQATPASHSLHEPKGVVGHDVVEPARWICIPK